MTRRYLLRDEVDGVLRRGNSVECFLGPCERAGKPGVRHLSLNLDDGAVVVGLFETQDLGDPTFLDLYEFGPLNEALELGDADQTIRFSSLDECLAFMEDRWPGSSGRIINEGIIQDVYADFLAARSTGLA